MVADIRRLISAQPFVPFTIHLADGGEVHVPTVDHAHVFPTGNRFMVIHDDDSYDLMPPLLISRITVNGEAIQTA